MDKNVFLTRKKVMTHHKLTLFLVYHRIIYLLRQNGQ